MSSSTTPPRIPYAFEDSSIAVFLTDRIDAVQKKNQREIACEIGYDKPNMISMFKSGATKVPLEKSRNSRRLWMSIQFIFFGLDSINIGLSSRKRSLECSTKAD